jgi:hypothetical protein
MKWLTKGWRAGVQCPERAVIFIFNITSRQTLIPTQLTAREFKHFGGLYTQMKMKGHYLDI